MAGRKTMIKVRPLAPRDVDAILNIDHMIRQRTKLITYADHTTTDILTARRRKSWRHPTSSYYEDLFTLEASALPEVGFVAEVENQVRGFIVGKVMRHGRQTAPVGTISILGVHPDYWRSGIGTVLADAICEAFRTRGVKTVHTWLDHRDEELKTFYEHTGFTSGYLIDYSKKL